MNIWNLIYISTVKNLFRILGITLLTALYCSTISLDNGISQNFGFINKSDSGKEKKDTTVSINLLYDIYQSESLAEPFYNTPPLTFKNQFNPFFSIERVREQFFANAFTQYISTTRNFLIKNLKANIIFPFHYFW